MRLFDNEEIRGLWDNRYADAYDADHMAVAAMFEAKAKELEGVG